MKREDLFLAIGQVESSRLERSELAVPSREPEEDKTMSVRPRRIFRNLLIAAVIVSLLTVTAYAAVGYLIFESPEAMITAIFGDKTGYDHKGVTKYESCKENQSPLYHHSGLVWHRIRCADELRGGADAVPWPF